MSKKHFIALADTLQRLFATIEKKSENVPTRDGDGYQTEGRSMIEVAEVRYLVERELSGFCSDQNGRFDRERWLGYIAGECGPNGGKL